LPHGNDWDCWKLRHAIENSEERNVWRRLKSFNANPYLKFTGSICFDFWLLLKKPQFWRSKWRIAIV
jgi:hypothetical protein